MFLMPVTAIATLFMPAGLQLYFVVSSALQLLQSAVFYNPTFRKLVGLAPLVPPRPVSAQSNRPVTAQALWQNRVIDTTAKPVAESPLESMKRSFEATKQKVADMSAKGDVKAARTKARDYEEKKNLEDEEHILAVREAARLKKLQQRK